MAKPAQAAAPKQADTPAVWDPEEEMKRQFSKLPLPAPLPEAAPAAAPAGGDDTIDFQKLSGSSSTQPAADGAPAGAAAPLSKPAPMAPKFAYHPKLT